MPRLVVPHSDIPGSGKSAERCFCARKICKIVRKRKEKNSSNCLFLFVENTVYNSLTKFSRFFCVQNKGYQLNAKCAKLYAKEKWKTVCLFMLKKQFTTAWRVSFSFFPYRLREISWTMKCEKLYAKNSSNCCELFLIQKETPHNCRL